MRRVLMTGITISSSMMIMLGYQNCTKAEIKESKKKIHYVEASLHP